MSTKFQSEEIREIFLRFFEEKEHLRIPGASLIPHNDPTLLYINSGMAPLKRYFVGEEAPPRPDLCNVQPCIRTRDIDDVGDRHHLTFFEMLGSWSIDNYFKQKAIELAFELLVDRFGLPAERLYATVYRGNPAINLPPDEESARAWESVGLGGDRIVFLGEDNFWGPAGEHGPCGPCTEVFWDTGEQFGPAYRPGGEFDSKSRYIEIWNAGVFMEFNKLPDGSFSKLRFCSVDTGSGLERMTMTLNGLSSVYETDLMAPMLALVQEQLAGTTASEAEQRIVTDHLRAATFILAEGVAPSNEGRGYIPRRLIRKSVAIAVRAGVRDFDFAGLIGAVVDKLGPHYPVLAQHRGRAVDAFAREQRDFERVIKKGLERLDALCRASPFVVAGRDVFALFSTYGMPVELVRDIVRERGGSIDEVGYQAEFRQHQEVSRAAPSGAAGAGASPWPRRLDHVAAAGLPATRFLGYERPNASARVLALFRNGAAVERASAGEQVELIAAESPFYGESGGQVGDRGTIAGANGCLSVSDTQRADAVVVHRATVESGCVAVGDAVELAIDAAFRARVVLNHSATHLMHAALREVLGPHVKQAGSLVDEARLRFDFHHPAKMTPDEIERVERIVNAAIRANHDKQTVETTYDDAVRQGALAFFGENYGDSVRMVRFGPASIELCGGTHVTATGDIGMFRIVSESSIASGIRRVVAVTGAAALDETLRNEQVLREVASLLKVGVHDVVERVGKLLSGEKSAAKAAAPAVAQVDIERHVKTSPSGTRYVGALLDGDPNQVRDEAQRVAGAIGGVACLVGRDDGKARIVIAVEGSHAKQCDARKLLTELVPLVDGKGGGKPSLAQGGGPRVAGIDDILKTLPAALARVEGG
jgi:alanyl-tRNA synthetase